jgi:diguanylate cyclase (GGDEF)-like protein
MRNIDDIRLDRQLEALCAGAPHGDRSGAWTRWHILEHLNAKVSTARRAGAALTVVVLDIDHFKSLNDRYGHPAGDAVLREVATRVLAVLGADARVGRYGHGDFLIVLPGCGATEGRSAAERIMSAVAAAPFPLAGASGQAVRVSLGLATTIAGAAEASSLLQAADRALQRAKAKGRHRAEHDVLVATDLPV